MRRTISAVITTHRRPQLLLRALRSIAAEEHAPDEILIVEDGEDPDLPGLLAETGISHRLIQGRCGGAAAARNRALREAKGDYIIFLDDDDVAYPARIRQLTRAVHEHDADLVFGATLKKSDAGHWPVPTHYPPEPTPVDFRCVLSCMPHINAVLVRREILLAAGGFRSQSTYFDDWCAWLTLLDRGARAHYTPALVAEFSDTPHGLTRSVLESGSLAQKIREALTCVAWTEPAHRGLVARVLDALPAYAESLRSYDDYADHRFVHPSHGELPVPEGGND